MSLGIPGVPDTAFLVSIDFESQSICDLKRRGSYVYAEHPSTSPLCLTIHDYDSGRWFFWTPTPRRLVMPEGFGYEHGLDFLRDMVTDPRGCVILAHNHTFEHAIWTRTLKLPEPLAWIDSMDKCLSLGLPGSLDKAGMYLFGVGKDHDGLRALQSIWGPNKKGVLPIPTDNQIQAIVNYNARDVYLQDNIVRDYGLVMEPPWEEEVRQLHSRVNRGGLHIDQQFARQLRDWDNVFKTAAADDVANITGGLIKRKDLTRREFMRGALNEQLPKGLQLQNMQLATLENLLDSEEDIDADVIKVVKNYLVFSRAALSKVDAALNCVAGDGRAYAQLRYWGAATGRWSGSQIQIQNLKRPHEDFDIDAASAAVAAGDLDAFTRHCTDTKGKLYAPYELLGSLIRGIIVPQPGCSFVISDFAQIESRGLLWLADDMSGLEEERETVRRGSDSYCTLATSMFGYEVTKKHKKERAGGKVGRLACGYQGGINAVLRMAEGMGIDLAEAGIDPQFVVDGYRNKCPKVVRHWRECENAFRLALTSSRHDTFAVGGARGGVHFVRLGNVPEFGTSDRCAIRMMLPSGRYVTYTGARLIEDPRGNSDKRVIAYDVAGNGQVLTRTTYGGKICENETQAFCRDLLADAMLRTDEKGWDIAFHVHDEEICEVPTALAEQCVDEVRAIMHSTPPWAEGMFCASEPEIAQRYKK
jgi:DNA polymerase